MGEEFAYGVDFGWVSQLEAQGVTWADNTGAAIDPIEAAVSFGTNAIRLRVFVNPPKEAYWEKSEDETCMLGYCDKSSVLKMSERIKGAGLRLLIDFHYSDHFADPQIQDIPKSWKNESFDGLKKKVAEHTEEMLELLKEHAIEPDWVQVGNEINKGMLWDAGRLEKNPEQLVELLNSGYDAVKAVFPNCPVITHLSGIPNRDWYEPFLDNFFPAGGKTDILGFSYYPYWYKMMGQAEHDKEKVYEELKRILSEYEKPVMICEIGGEEEKPEETRQLLKDAVEALKRLPERSGLGIFYWEPEVGAALMPDHYPLGAARPAGDRVLCFTDAMQAYLDTQKLFSM